MWAGNGKSVVAMELGVIPELRTDRLLLRAWRDSDRAPFAAINADRQVCEFLPGPLSREQSDDMVERIVAGFRERGFGLWAVEWIGEREFIGFVGLSVPRFEARFTPCVEAGWRIDLHCWNRGLATEGARAAVEFAFASLKLPEVVSFTVPENVRSRRVMEKLGMTHLPADDFTHPLLPADHRLSHHVLYRLAAPRRHDDAPLLKTT